MDTVAPLVGAWIEIRDSELCCKCDSVAPLVGAWIEIISSLTPRHPSAVAPLVGAWIEIIIWRILSTPLLSLLSWERGLK